MWRLFPGVSLLIPTAQMAAVKTQMLLDKAGNKVVAVVVAFPQIQFQRIVADAGGGL